MAVRTREEILGSVRARFGDDTSDDTLALVEDIADTIADLENRAKDTTNWEQKYKDNDEAWRKKYRDRFFSGGSDDEEGEENPEPTRKKYTFESLFKEG